jgi:hypothetical protein
MLQVKKIFFIAIILILVQFSKAQIWGVPHLTTFDDRRFNLGFSLGINTLDIGFTHYNKLDNNPGFSADAVRSVNEHYMMELDSIGRKVRADIPTLIPGFTVAIISNLRISEYLDLRFMPGLSFGNRKIAYNIPIHDFTNPSNVNDYSLRSTYIDFPFLIKYKSKRIINQRPYLIGGIVFKYDISKSANEELLRLKRFGTYAEAGMGWDSYLQFFRFSAEIKYSFGLNNALAPPPDKPQLQYYNMAFRRLSAHIITLCFNFES